MVLNNYDPNAWENTAPWYASYLLKKDEKPHYSYIYERIAQEYKPGMKILEVGCAGGHDYKHLCGHCPVDNYTGVDITKAYIDVARNNYPKAKWVVGDARELPFKDQEFDITFCMLMLLHLDRAGVVDAIHEMARVTKSIIFIHTYAAERRYDSIRLEPGKDFPKPAPGMTCTIMPQDDNTGSVIYSTALESAFNARYFLYNVCALNELTAPGWTTDWINHDGLVGVAGHKNTFFEYIPEDVDITYEFEMRRDKK